MSVIDPLPWWPRIGVPLMAAMSTASPEVLGDVARRRQVAVAALERRHRGPQAAVGQELEHGQHAAVDLAALRMSLRPHVVDVDARVVEHALLQLLLGHQQDLADGRACGRPSRRTGSCPRRGRSPWTRAASSRRGSAWGRSAGAFLPGGLDRELDVRATVWPVSPMRPRIVPAMTCEPCLQRLELDVLAVQAEDLGEVVREGGEAGELAGSRRAAACRRPCRRPAGRVRVQALLLDAHRGTAAAAGGPWRPRRWRTLPLGGAVRGRLLAALAFAP